jgi:hypothetical protein
MSSTSHDHASPLVTHTASGSAASAVQPLNWSYPLMAGSGQTAVGTQAYFRALSQAEDGFYPLGANGLWHGGIHLGAGPGGLLTPDSPLLSIADGEVVAYRLDTQYPELDYPDSKKVLYSTGFVLVRHTLVLPNTSGSSRPPPADETLEFYCLYMHLLDWAGYQAAEKDQDEDAARLSAPIRRMPYWKGTRRFCVGRRCTHTQRPAQVRLSTRADPLGDFIANDFRSPAPDSPSLPEFTLPGTYIQDWENGNVIGLLPQGSEVTVVGNANSGWARIAQIVKGEPVGLTVGQPAARHAAEYGWVHLDELELMIDPDPLDEVVVLDTPFPVRAGDVVGYPGHYLRHRDASALPAKPTRALVHLEVFAGDGLAAFIEKSRKRDAVLPDSQKTMLTVSVGAKLVTPSEPDQTIAAGLRLKPVAGGSPTSRWVKVHPMQLIPAPAAHGHAHHAAAHQTETPVGNPLWVERSLSGQTMTTVVNGWKKFPLQLANATAPAAGFEEVFSGADLGQLETAQDEDDMHWWLITAGTGEGDTASGWVCGKHHPKTQWQSPWAWPGFEVVDNTGVAILDAFKRDVYVAERVLDGEAEEFKPSALSVNGSPLITRLEKAVDHLGNGDGRVSARELAQAYGISWLAKALSHLVVRYESEWGGDMSKWHALSNMMKAGKSRWQVELQRIEKLQWWDKVKAVKGFPASPLVYHFHPVGLIGNFARVGDRLDELIRKIGDIIAGGEGGYEAYNTGTKNMPGGAVGHSYMNPPSGTVTNKTIDQILATESLSGTDNGRFFATGKYQTVFATLKLAKAAMNLSGSEKYDAAMQEQVFREYLIDKAGDGVLSKFVKKGQGTIDEAQYAAAKEWASIAVPSDMTTRHGAISNGSLSYYQGVANHSFMESTNRLRELLGKIQKCKE